MSQVIVTEKRAIGEEFLKSIRSGATKSLTGLGIKNPDIQRAIMYGALGSALGGAAGAGYGASLPQDEDNPRKHNSARLALLGALFGGAAGAGLPLASGLSSGRIRMPGEAEPPPPSWLAKAWHGAARIPVAAGEKLVDAVGPASTLATVLTGTMLPASRNALRDIASATGDNWYSSAGRNPASRVGSALKGGLLRVVAPDFMIQKATLGGGGSTALTTPVLQQLAKQDNGLRWLMQNQYVKALPGQGRAQWMLPNAKQLVSADTLVPDLLRPGKQIRFGYLDIKAVRELIAKKLLVPSRAAVKPRLVNQITGTELTPQLIKQLAQQRALGAGLQAGALAKGHSRVSGLAALLAAGVLGHKADTMLGWK